MVFEVFDRLWKVWAFVPILLLLIAIAILLYNNATTGSFIQRDAELAGGNLITVDISGDVDLSALEAAMPYAKFSITRGVTNELLVETTVDYDPNEILDELASLGVTGASSVETVGPALGEIFWNQAQLAIIAAFVLMAVVVFILFRTIVPSGIVIFSVVADAVTTVAVISLLDIKLSLYVLAALLMISFSVLAQGQTGTAWIRTYCSRPSFLRPEAARYPRG